MTRVLLSLSLLLTLAAPAQAQTIAQMVGGVFAAAGLNETTLDSTVDDPPKHRLGVIRQDNTWGRGLGAFSFDLVSPNGSRDELVLIQGKETEGRPNTGDYTRGGEFYLGLKKPHAGSTDDAMFDALVATYLGGFKFNLPIYAPNLTGGGVATSFLQAGRFQLHLQATDGNFVLYELIGATFCPRWAITWLPHNGTGYIDPVEAGLNEVCR